jgi:hypothetical protein
VPDDFWYTPDVADAFTRTDIAQLVRLVQRETGASQTHIGTAVGIAQPKISDLMTPHRVGSPNRSIAVMRRIARGLAMPHHVAAAFLLGEAPHRKANDRPPHHNAPQQDLADVTAIYATRSEFTAHMPPHTLFDNSTEVSTAGLSLNLLCQNYPDNRLLPLLERGTHVRALFLDPEGHAVKAREHEEGWPAGHLSSLTALNIQGLLRTRTRLPAEHRNGLQIAVYDETIRFNITLVDQRLCIAQPYLPDSRGVDSPTFVIHRRRDDLGLYLVFDQLFNAMWKRARQL